jgi:two-component system response regulator DesR
MIAEDEHVIRTAMATMLDLEDDIEVVGQAASGDEALAVLRATAPDVALMDLQMPGIDGIEVAARLDRDAKVAVIILTSHAQPGHLKRALAHGVLGFLPKTASATALTGAIRDAAQGKRHIDANLATAAIVAGDSPLTPRETEVLGLAAVGASVSQIAARAFLAPGTVRNYLSSACAKLGAANRHQALAIAQAKGWI